ncbi:phage portal protein [Mesorhizobium sp. SB112]|uniref:phage portal protein n=1 Tax=Mesorhizobium sp. SB112 TaxID=3151853 RepID=UPI003264D13D
MSIIESVKTAIGIDTEKKSVPLTNPFALEIFGAAPTIAGPSINATTALRVPAVFSAIVLLSGAIGSLPAKLFCRHVSDERSGTGGKRTANDHPAYRLIHDEANEWTSAGEFRRALTTDALLHDHGFAHVGRNFAGRPVLFTRLDPRSITIRFDEISGEPSYIQRDAKNREQVFSFRDILHISSPLDLSPIKAGREAIALSSVLERHAAQLFGSGARPSAILSKEGKAGADNGATVIANIKKAWRNWQSNGNNDPLILDDGWKYDPATMTSTDAQFLENRRFQLEEIARLFRIPPPMLFDLTRATWSNSEEMAQQFLTLTLRPWLEAWEWAYARVLLSPEERADGFYIEFVLDDLLSANAATRATTYGQYRAMGALTANEVRSGLNLPAIAGADKLDNPHITPGKPTGQNDNRSTGEEAA